LKWLSSEREETFGRGTDPGKKVTRPAADRHLTPGQFRHVIRNVPRAGPLNPRRRRERSCIVSTGTSRTHRTAPSSSSSHARALRAATRSVIESLEARQLLTAAGTVDLALTAGLFAPSGDFPTAVVRQGSKTLVAGVHGSSGDGFVARFNADGTADNTFGTAGRTTIDFGGDDTIRAITLDGAGNILVGGTEGLTGGTSDMAVARLSADGVVDTSFGGGDGVQTAHFTAAAGAFAIAEKDGVIALGGSTGSSFASQTFAVARIDASGVTAITTSTANRSVINALAFDATGNLFAGGEAVVTAGGPTSFALAKYVGASPAFGVLTTAVGTAANSSIKALALSVGNVVAIGDADSSVGIVRYDLATGAATSTFRDAATPFTVLGGGVTASNIYVTGATGGTLAVARYALTPATAAITSSVVPYTPDETSAATSVDAADGTVTLAADMLGRPGVGDFVFQDIAGGSAGVATVIHGESPAYDTVTQVLVDSAGRTLVAGNTRATPISSQHGFILRRLADGTPDLSFGINGVVDVNFDLASSETITGFALDAMGRVLVAGTAGTTAVVARYDTAGRLDFAFNGTGIATFISALTGTTVDTNFPVRVAADGNKVVLAGTAEDAPLDDGVAHLFAIRFDNAGHVDNTFNGGAPVRCDVASSLPYHILKALLVLPGGSIVLGGTATSDGSAASFVMAKYTASGTLDTTFGGGTGLVVDPVGGGDGDYAAINALVATPSGEIIAAGAVGPNLNYNAGDAGNAIAVVRYDANGLNPASPAPGSLPSAATVTGGAQDVAINASGKIFLATTVNGQLAAIRLTAALAIDNTFDSDGVAISSYPGAAAGIALTPTGQAVLAGTTAGVAADTDVALIRFNHLPTLNPITVGPVNALTPLTFTATGHDVDTDTGDTLTYSLPPGAPTGANIDPVTGAFTWTPTAAQAGNYTLTVRVTDTSGASADRSVNVTVNPVVVTGPSATLSGGVLTVLGDAAANSIVISLSGGSYHVAFGAAPALNFASGSVNRLVVNGGDGADRITVASSVNLSTELHGGAGNDSITGGSGDDLLFGEAGNDQLLGGNGADVFVGGDDDDVLTGGNGRDILIGGWGKDTITGQNGEDILVGGYTSADANPTALIFVRTIWNDANLSYAARIAALQFLALGHLFDDNAVDSLTGGNGSDWFIANTDTGFIDIITDAKKEIVTDTLP
jgi:uncharacterized delta-60 repeat protein